MSKIDSLQFQKKLKELLDSKLDQAKKSLAEDASTDEYFKSDEDEKESDTEAKEDSTEEDEESEEKESDEKQTPEELKSITDVEKSASENNSAKVSYEYGVFQTEFTSLDDAKKFIEFLEEYDNVDSFEFKNVDSETESEVDESSTGAKFRVWVYLNPEIVSYDYIAKSHKLDKSEEPAEADSTEETPAGEPEEVKKPSKQIKEAFDNEPTKDDTSELGDASKDPTEPRISLQPTKDGSVHYTCWPGYRYDAKSKTCVKVEGDDLTHIRKTVRNSIK